MESNKYINGKRKIISIIEKIIEVKEIDSKEITQFLNDDYIVGFSISGHPINRRIYKEELKSAKLDIKNGNVISHEDLEKESENW